MLGANDSTEAVCKGLVPFYDVPGLLIAMLALHAVTLVMLISHTWAMATRACLDHPVFAVVFQEMVVLSISASVDSSLLVLSILVQSDLLVVAYLNMARMTSLFHPVTWAVVSILRYHLLIKNKDANDDMVTLRRRSLFAAWLIFVPLLVASLFTSIAPLIIGGWPKIPADHLSYKVFLAIAFGGALVSNLPDILSLVIYSFMWRHFKQSVNVLEGDGSVLSQPYGGIYLGPEELEEEELTQPPAQATCEEHKAKSVMRALRLHLKLSSADIALTLISYFMCNFYVISFFFIYQTVCFFWLPFLVIRSSFKQLVKVSVPVVTANCFA